MLLPAVFKSAALENLLSENQTTMLLRVVFKSAALENFPLILNYHKICSNKKNP